VQSAILPASRLALARGMPSCVITLTNLPRMIGELRGVLAGIVALALGAVPLLLEPHAAASPPKTKSARTLARLMTSSLAPVRAGATAVDPEHSTVGPAPGVGLGDRLLAVQVSRLLRRLAEASPPERTPAGSVLVVRETSDADPGQDGGRGCWNRTSRVARGRGREDVGREIRGRLGRAYKLLSAAGYARRTAVWWSNEVTIPKLPQPPKADRDSPQHCGRLPELSDVGVDVRPEAAQAGQPIVRLT
jgi:hypothetical protein